MRIATESKKKRAQTACIPQIVRELRRSLVHLDAIRHSAAWSVLTMALTVFQFLVVTNVSNTASSWPR